MYYTQSAKELAKYEAITQKVLIDLPSQVTYRVVEIDENNISIRLYFDGLPSDFWITDEGDFTYRDPEYKISQIVKKNELERAFHAYVNNYSIES